MDHRREVLIRDILGNFWNSPDFYLNKLTGDAGLRKYYRSGRGEQTVVVMDREEPYDGHLDPFINLTNYLAQHGLPVPEIILNCAGDGVLLLSDLGDITLQHEYQRSSHETIGNLYTQVFDILIRMHTSCADDASKDGVEAFNYRFDFEKLRWEMDFFLMHFVSRYRKRELKNSDLNVLNTGFDFICRTLEKEPLVLTHRDFHSRNLMVREKTVFMIDYQDARLGPPEYDLASVLRDAYVELPEKFITDFLDNYYRVTGDSRKSGWRRYIFSLMCLQRNIKALGTFGFQASSMFNSFYIQYIPLLKQHIFKELDYLDSIHDNRYPHLPDAEVFQSLIGEVLE